MGLLRDDELGDELDVLLLVDDLRDLSKFVGVNEHWIDDVI